MPYDVAAMSRHVVLCVDDEIRSLETLERTLDEDFDVLTATSAEDALQVLEHERVDVVLCDQRMPGMTGVEFLVQVRERWPHVARLILSGYTDAEDIIRGLNEAGIFQYLTKPWHPDNLLLTLRNACRMVDLQQQNEHLNSEIRLTTEQAEAKIEEKKARLKKAFSFREIVRCDESPLNAVLDQVARVAPYDISCLITGPSGTGKELFARALHYNSLRHDKPFIVENCGAMPDELLSSELFGHRKGAFTGAISDHIGLFEQANGGTLFLDEIGEISPAFQVKLLRVLQEREVRRVGDSQRRPVDVRIIASTNRSLEDEVRAGHFREDLYYRLAEVIIELPPLAKRAVDLPVLADHCLQKASKAFDKPAEGFSDEAIACLKAYNWPGNIRELQNEIRRMLVLADEPILGADLLSPRVLRAAPEEQSPVIEHIAGLSGTLKERIDHLELQVLRETLIRNRWNKSRAARELGLSRVGLRAKIERFGLTPSAVQKGEPTETAEPADYRARSGGA